MPTFTNQAALLFNNTSIPSNIAVGEIVDVLTMNKTATPLTYSQGDTITYVVNLTNTSPQALQGIIVDDNLGAYTIGTAPTTLYPLTYVEGSAAFYVNGALQTRPAAQMVDNRLQVTGLNLPGNGLGALVYQAVVNNYARVAQGSTITNEVIVSGGGLTAPLTGTATITAAERANLSINKTITPVPVLENGQVTYRFEILNYGNTATTAADTITLSDVFNPIVDISSVTYNAGAWTEPANYTYNRLTGLFQTVENQITVPAATVTQDPTTGLVNVVPGSVVIEVTGTI